MEKFAFTATIDFAAQFGGLDAQNLILPHFKALKTACRNMEIENFPFANLTFILRVDGNIRSFDFSGLDNIKMNRAREYISVDLGIMRQNFGQVEMIICDAIFSSIETFNKLFAKKKWDYNSTSLKECILELISCYKDEIMKTKPV